MGSSHRAASQRFKTTSVAAALVAGMLVGTGVSDGAGAAPAVDPSTADWLGASVAAPAPAPAKKGCSDNPTSVGGYLAVSLYQYRALGAADFVCVGKKRKFWTIRSVAGPHARLSVRRPALRWANWRSPAVVSDRSAGSNRSARQVPTREECDVLDRHTGVHERVQRPVVLEDY
jgi:hypothetical protein